VSSAATGVRPFVLGDRGVERGQVRDVVVGMDDASMARLDGLVTRLLSEPVR